MFNKLIFVCFLLVFVDTFKIHMNFFTDKHCRMGMYDPTLGGDNNSPYELRGTGACTNGHTIGDKGGQFRFFCFRENIAFVRVLEMGGCIDNTYDTWITDGGPPEAVGPNGVTCNDGCTPTVTGVTYIRLCV